MLGADTKSGGSSNAGARSTKGCFGAQSDIHKNVASEPERKIALLLKSNLAEIGIKANIKPETGGRIGDLAANIEATPHMCFIFDTLKYPHVDSHTYGLLHSTATQMGSYRTMSWCINPETDKLLDRARCAIDPEEQMRLYEEVQDMATGEAPALYVYNSAHRMAMRDYVKGYTYVGLLGYDLSFWHLSVEK